MPVFRQPGFWKRLEARGDAWAAKRLSPDEFAEAVDLDRRLKANWVRWLLWYFAGIVLFTIGLMLIKGGFDSWPTAFLMANLLGMCGVVFMLSAWYGYRKWTGARARRNFVLFVGAILLGGAGGIVGDMPTEKVEVSRTFAHLFKASHLSIIPQ